MAKVLNAFTKPFRWLKWAWARDPVIFMSCVFGISGPVFVFFSPWTEDTVKTMKSIPHVYPYPQLENQDVSNLDTQGDKLYPEFPI